MTRQMNGQRNRGYEKLIERQTEKQSNEQTQTDKQSNTQLNKNTKSYQNTFSVCRVGLFWLFDYWTNNDGLCSADRESENIFVRPKIFVEI